MFLPFFLLGFVHHVLRYARKVAVRPAGASLADVPEPQPPARPTRAHQTGARSWF
jgi:hypothetical protein